MVEIKIKPLMAGAPTLAVGNGAECLYFAGHKLTTATHRAGRFVHVNFIIDDAIKIFVRINDESKPEDV